MPLRLAVALSALALLSSCGGEPEVAVSPDQLEASIRSTQTPLVALLWAEWSRPAVELMPTAAELAAEYEGVGVAFCTVSLERSPGEDLQRILERFPDSARHFTLEEDPMETLARFGLTDIPAVLLYAPGGELRMRLDSPNGDPLTPADLADAIESLLAKR